mmetsp:Transcript_57249/g.147232  ORF Transcript_57249/g.147232 Transcript_57249/m.147232 type:complete len:205 (-) Transcript_57249:80-694(-)
MFLGSMFLLSLVCLVRCAPTLLRTPEALHCIPSTQADRARSGRSATAWSSAGTRCRGQGPHSSSSSPALRASPASPPSGAPPPPFRLLVPKSVPSDCMAAIMPSVLWITLPQLVSRILRIRTRNSGKSISRLRRICLTSCGFFSSASNSSESWPKTEATSHQRLASALALRSPSGQIGEIMERNSMSEIFVERLARPRKSSRNS